MDGECHRFNHSARICRYRVFIFGKVIYQSYLPNCSVVFEGPFQINGAFAEKNVVAVGAEIPEGHLDCPLHQALPVNSGEKQCRIPNWLLTWLRDHGFQCNLISAETYM